MSRRPARCTQADIARAIKAVEQTHAHMVVEILPDGTIRIEPADERNRNNNNALYDEIDNRAEIVL
jgi:hypothetical protein